jgi:hypothetical protein
MTDKSEGLDKLLNEPSTEINGDLLDPQSIDKTRRDLEKDH